jgi:hypothetical protein
MSEKVALVIGTVFVGDDTAPSYILESGIVMSPSYVADSCGGWNREWKPSKSLTAEVQAGVSGSGQPGWNIRLLENGHKIAFLTASS